MEARLTIQNGSRKGSSFLIRDGQLIRFGRTAWSDVSIPYGSELADVHFSLETGSRGVVLTDLSRGKGTQVDGKPVRKCVLESNQTIQAGGLEFLIEIQAGQSSILGSSANGSRMDGEAASPSTIPDARAVCQDVDLSRGAKSVPVDGMRVDQFVETLTHAKLWNDAWGVLVGWLGKPAVVGWTAAEFVRLRGENLEPVDLRLLTAVQAWAVEPGEATTKSISDLLETDEQTSAASWVALAAVWSGKSLTPAGSPPVAPARGLTAKALNAAWNLLSAELNPNKREQILSEAFGLAVKLQTSSPA